jgi:hypothetical protein
VGQAGAETYLLPQDEQFKLAQRERVKEMEKARERDHVLVQVIMRMLLV